MRQTLLRDSLPVVLDAQHRETILGIHRNQNGTARPIVVDGIADKIHADLAEFVRIPETLRGLRLKLERHTLLVRDRPKKCNCFLGYSVQLTNSAGVARLSRLDPRQQKQGLY